MLKHLTLAEAQANFAALSSLTAQEPIVITEAGKPVMAVIAYEQLMELLETVAVLSDRVLAEQLEPHPPEAPHHPAEPVPPVTWEETKRKFGL